MGLLQELSKYLEAKGDLSTLVNDNNSLREENQKLKEENTQLLFDRDTEIIRRNSALDEVALCQKRIDSLLRQLREKNNGR